jgi:hypothetical protein
VALDTLDGIGGDEVAAFGVAENRAEDHQHLLRGPRSRVAGVPGLDLLARDRPQITITERGEQVGVEGLAVVALGGALDPTLEHAVSEPVLGDVHEPGPRVWPRPGREARRVSQQGA